RTTPRSGRAPVGGTDIRRGRPSLKAARAALTTAASAQPPPIQPAVTEPSRRIRALAPALAAVTATVRTTVASANGSPAAFIAFTASRTSIGCCLEGGGHRRRHARRIGVEGGQRLEIVRRRE